MVSKFKKAEEHPPFIVENAHAGTVVYPPGGKLGPRTQRYVQLVLLHTGSMEITIDGRLHHLPVGHVAMLKPGHTESFVFAKEQETWHRWISTSVANYNDRSADLDELPFYIPTSKRMNELVSLMYGISQEYQKVNDELLCSLGQSAIWLYITECRNTYQHNSHPAVLKAKETVQHHFSEDLNLLEIAKRSNVSPEHLIRLFQTHEQMTPIHYLWQYRIQHGIQLLRGTGLQVGEIAFQTGFKTSHHFSNAVKSHTGSTPTQLREESRNLL